MTNYALCVQLFEGNDVFTLGGVYVCGGEVYLIWGQHLEMLRGYFCLHSQELLLS